MPNNQRAASIILLVPNQDVLATRRGQSLPTLINTVLWSIRCTHTLLVSAAFACHRASYYQLKGCMVLHPSMCNSTMIQLHFLLAKKSEFFWHVCKCFTCCFGIDFQHRLFFVKCFIPVHLASKDLFKWPKQPSTPACNSTSWEKHPPSPVWVIRAAEIIWGCKQTPDFFISASARLAIFYLRRLFKFTLISTATFLLASPHFSFVIAWTCYLFALNTEWLLCLFSGYPSLPLFFVVS